jgi:hypothetical protein
VIILSKSTHYKVHSAPGRDRGRTIHLSNRIAEPKRYDVKTIYFLLAAIGLTSCNTNVRKDIPKQNDTIMATTSDFTTTLLVDQTPKEVFYAINNVRGWWSEEIDGNTDKLHAEFNYHYQDVHRAKMKLIEIVPDKKVVWLVEDNYFNFTKDKHEWKGTKIIFEISEMNHQTQLRFTHLGLVPEYECYDICQDAWTNYIHTSLHDLIVTGKGQPNPKEGGFNQQLIDEYTDNGNLQSKTK